MRSSLRVRGGELPWRIWGVVVLVACPLASGDWVCNDLQHGEECKVGWMPPVAELNEQADAATSKARLKRPYGYPLVLVDPPGGFGPSLCALARDNDRTVDDVDQRACAIYGTVTQEDLNANGTMLTDFLSEHSALDFVVSSLPLPWHFADQHIAYMTVLGDPVARTVTHYLSRGVEDAPRPPHTPPPAPPPAAPPPPHLAGQPRFSRVNRAREQRFWALASEKEAQLRSDHKAALKASGFRPHERFLRWLRQQPDNYMVRLLCGFDCHRVPRGQLRRTHLNKAKSNLERFSLVLNVERLKEMSLLLTHVFGWSNATNPAYRLHIHATSEEVKFLERMRRSEEVDTELIGMHLWELALKRHVDSLVQDKLAEYYAATFAAANAHCQHSCCGFQCDADVYYDRALDQYKSEVEVKYGKYVPQGGRVVESSAAGVQDVKEALRTMIRDREMGVVRERNGYYPGSEGLARTRYVQGVGRGHRNVANRRGILDPKLRAAHQQQMAADGRGPSRQVGQG